MKKNKRKIRRQLILISFLFVVLLLSVGMIYLGATVFRSQLPFFQLIDAEASLAEQLGPKPEPNPGVTEVEFPEGVRLFLILGSDYRPQAGSRTDIIILVAVDQRSGKASLVSFPRDLWISIPGYGEGRINTAMQLGGFPLLANTLQTNFGVYPSQYAMIDMEGFLQVIDVLGGIEITTDAYTADACDPALDPDGWCEVGPGTVTMDSSWALWYVRARYNSSDFDRMRRTQEVVKAVFDKVTSPVGVLKIPELTRLYESEVESNIPPDQLLPLTRLGMGFDSSTDIRRFTIGPNETTSWTTPEGGAVLLPNTPAIQLILQEATIFE